MRSFAVGRSPLRPPFAVCRQTKNGKRNGAYRTAVRLERDVDKPRNFAKSVMVE